MGCAGGAAASSTARIAATAASMAPVALSCPRSRSICQNGAVDRDALRDQLFALRRLAMGEQRRERFPKRGASFGRSGVRVVRAGRGRDHRSREGIVPLELRVESAQLRNDGVERARPRGARAIAQLMPHTGDQVVLRREMPIDRARRHPESSVTISCENGASGSSRSRSNAAARMRWAVAVRWRSRVSGVAGRFMSVNCHDDSLLSTAPAVGSGSAPCGLMAEWFSSLAK